MITFSSESNKLNIISLIIFKWYSIAQEFALCFKQLHKVYNANLIRTGFG